MNFAAQVNSQPPADFMQFLYYNFLLNLYGSVPNNPPVNTNNTFPSLTQKSDEQSIKVQIPLKKQEPEKTPEISDKKPLDLNQKKAIRSHNLQGKINAKKHVCNCSKTNCLKLYCDCFANGELCDLECQCKGCCNTEKSTSLRSQVILNIKLKNPFAFENKYKKEKVKKVNNKGCNCKKSKCLKKYCDCFLEGCACTANCKCEDCLNKGTEEGVGEKNRKILKGNTEEEDKNLCL